MVMPLPVDEESEQSEYEGKIYTFCQVIITYSKATQILLSCVETPASEESRETDSGAESDEIDR